MHSAPEKIIHANCIGIENKGLLILGASGAGKSTLSLQLLSIGATLVADDRTKLSVKGQNLYAQAVPSIQGHIEARGIGVLSVPYLDGVRVVAVVDLDQNEVDRIPPERTTSIFGIKLPHLLKVDSPAFASALLHYVKYKRSDAP